jgi:hypothetical protein
MKGKLMVLGPMQLGVLRKLKEQGTLKTGVHPSVHALVREGFVNYGDDGFSIAETGQLALMAYGEMDDTHREILMRLKRAETEKRLYHKSALKTPAETECFDDLLLWDLVDVDELDNISLTDTGRNLWEIALKAHALRDETKVGFDAANEQQRQKKYERKQVAKPQKQGATELKKLAQTIVNEAVKSAEQPVISNSVTTEEPAENCIGADCTQCLDHEVLELIAAKYPKVQELRQALLQQKQILKELGL